MSKEIPTPTRLVTAMNHVCSSEDHKSYFSRPHWTRRHFFKLAGASLTGSFLLNQAKAADSSAQSISLQASEFLKTTPASAFYQGDAPPGS